MTFTFGIITGGNNDIQIDVIIDSIEYQNIPKEDYEIIIVGNSKIVREKTTVILFEEHPTEMWITKKKNIVITNATKENIVFLHDYIYFLEDWYQGYLTFGNDFHACMNRILNNDGSRFRDWCDLGKMRRYEDLEHQENMYFSGTYWVAKTEVMREIPLNDSLFAGQAEDHDWSRRFLKKYQFSLNLNSTVQLMRQKERILPY